jgi:hypothetical protein
LYGWRGFQPRIKLLTIKDRRTWSLSFPMPVIRHPVQQLPNRIRQLSETNPEIFFNSLIQAGLVAYPVDLYQLLHMQMSRWS